MAIVRSIKRLSPAQHRALVLYHLGGIEALRYNSGKPVACRTVGALMDNGYFDKAGPTAKGREYMAEYGNSDFGA